MNLDPERYLCPIHRVDLTELVRRRLSSVDSADVAFGRIPWLQGRSAKPRPKPFQVEVSCPAEGSPHRQICEGAYTP